MSTFKRPTRVAFYAQTHTHGELAMGERVCKRPEGTREYRTLMHMLRTDTDVRYVGWQVID